MVVKLHLWLGQGLIRTPGSTQQFITDGGDPRDTWFATNGTVLVYDHAQDRLGNGLSPFYSALLSNTWYEGAIDPDPTTWGPDLSFLQELRDDDPLAAHCFLKLGGRGTLRANGGAAPHRWDKAGADLYLEVLAAVTAAKNAILAVLTSETVELGSILLCFGYIEAAGFATLPGMSTGLAADIEQLIADLRTDIAPIIGGAATAPVLLYRVHTGTRQSLGGPYIDAGVDNCRSAVNQAAAKLQKVQVVDVDQTALRSDRIFSTADGTRDVGRAVWKAYQRAEDPTAVPAIDGGIPVVFYLGQSNVVGQRPKLMLSQALIGDPQIQKFSNGLPVAWPDVWTYDHAAETIVPYNPSDNDNTHPNETWSSSEAFGPSVTLVAGLRKLHPGGFVLFKLGVGSSSIGNNTLDLPVWAKKLQALTYATGPLVGTGRGIWPHLERGWRLCRQQIIEVTGRIPEPSLIVWHQGESDTEEGLAAIYAAKLREHLTDIRALVADSTKLGAVVPVGIVRTRKVPGGPFDIPGTDLVRAAQESVAKDPGNFLVDADPWPYYTDLVHLSAEGTLRAGRDIVAALPDSYHAACAPSGGA